MFEHSHYSGTEIAERRQAKARWKAIQQRLDNRAYLEHLALIEQDEPLLGQCLRYTSDED